MYLARELSVNIMGIGTLRRVLSNVCDTGHDRLEFKSVIYEWIRHWKVYTTEILNLLLYVYNPLGNYFSNSFYS